MTATTSKTTAPKTPKKGATVAWTDRAGARRQGRYAGTKDDTSGRTRAVVHTHEKGQPKQEVMVWPKQLTVVEG